MNAKSKSASRRRPVQVQADALRVRLQDQANRLRAMTGGPLLQYPGLVSLDQLYAAIQAAQSVGTMSMGRTPFARKATLVNRGLISGAQLRSALQLTIGVTGNR